MSPHCISARPMSAGHHDAVGLDPMEARVTEGDLHRLGALLERGSSCTGGLPITLRVELGAGLHALERFRASR